MTIKELCEQLEDEYAPFLQDEGKWLVDFRNIFKLDGRGRIESVAEAELLRREVFCMLPDHIKFRILNIIGKR